MKPRCPKKSRTKKPLYYVQVIGPAGHDTSEMRTIASTRKAAKKLADNAMDNIVILDMNGSGTWWTGTVVSIHSPSKLAGGASVLSDSWKYDGEMWVAR